MQDTWEWSSVELAQDASRPSPRDFAGMVDLPGSRLLLFGGLDASEKRLDDTWIFESVTYDLSHGLTPCRAKSVCACYTEQSIWHAGQHGQRSRWTGKNQRRGMRTH